MGYAGHPQKIDTILPLKYFFNNNVDEMHSIFEGYMQIKIHTLIRLILLKAYSRFKI
jgi:hypothetical protein